MSKLRFCLSCSVCLSLLPAAPTAAQEQGETVLGEIVVSGERTTRSLITVLSGISVFVNTAPELGAAGVQVNDLVGKSPNAFVQGKSELPSLRGVQGGGAGGLVSALTTGAPPRLPVIVDGVSRPTSLVNSSFTSLWDVRQVEVLRGPQSLLRGRVGIAGAMVVETNDPSDVLEGAVQTGIKVDGYNGPEYVINGMISGPITDDITGRLTVERSGGDDAREVVGGGQDWMTEYEMLRVRGKLIGTLDLGEYTTDWKLLADVQDGVTPQTRNNVQGPALTGQNFSERLILPTSPTRSFDTFATSLGFLTNTDFGDYRLETVSSFSRDTFDSVEEQTYASFFDVGEDVWSQDVILHFGEGDLLAGEIGGLAGLALERRHQDVLVSGAIGASLDITSVSTSLYSDLRYGLTDQLDLLAGARVQRFDDERFIETAVAFPPPLGTVRGTESYDEVEVALLPQIGLSYQIDPDQTIGATIRRGYNPGGAAVNFFTGAPYQYDSETVWTFETTWRKALNGGDANIGITAFYSLHDNPQFYGETVPGDRRSLEVSNQRKGVSYGLELVGDWLIAEALQLNASAGLLHTEITEAAPGTPDIEGNDFGQAPSFTASLGATYEILENWSVDGRVTYVGEANNDFNNVTGDEVGDYAIVDVGSTYVWDHLTFRAYVNNLTNETGITRRVSGGYADVTDPRTFGLTVTAKF